MKPIQASQVTRTFGDFVAVDDVDIEVGAGEVVGLLGANGAGKTTLIRMVLGLLTPTAGRIRIFGQRHSRDQRRRIGYVPQNLGLYTDLSVNENLAFRAAVLGTDADPASQGEWGDTLVASMPLGAQRIAAFAAATQHRPDLFVLDEPTSGVSPLARSDLWDLIRQRAEAGAAVLVSTHYMDEAEQADRLVVMAQGKVAAKGSATEVIGGRETVEVTSERWSDAFGVLDNGTRHISLAGRHVRVLSGTVEAIRAELRGAGIDADVRLVAATLDETMVELNP